MRIYRTFQEALNEIRRDLAEVGIQVTTQTMQNKSREEGFEMLEIQNYIYTVTEPRLEDLQPTQPWADGEFTERVSGVPINPGNAWQLRPEIWKHFLVPTEYADGSTRMAFDYSYPARMYFQLWEIVKELKIHPDSRQLFLSVWDPQIDINRLGQCRVPCTLGYYFQKRKGKVNITYLQRSADYETHFQNDIYLAYRLLLWICDKAGCEPGMFTHWVGSLHVYKDDVHGVF